MSRPYADEEPSSDSRAFARNMRQLFVALVQEGFTEVEALALVGQVIAASIIGGAR